MITNKPQTTFRKDYQPPKYLIEHTDLVVDLDPQKTQVQCRMQVKRNHHAASDLPDLLLHGVDLTLQSILLDDKALTPDQYSVLDDTLIVRVTKAHFTLEIHSIVQPVANTTLEGLYLSNAMYCTQCEAEGFRKITYYLDRPDVMSRFRTKIIAAKKKYPYLLSNGNLVDKGDMENGKHWALWEDPFPKPSYLFALVAGDFACIEDSYITGSGKEVSLKIFTEKHNSDKCDHAMQSLKKAMRWDEKVFGREYDLDVYMIVAVEHFNMGAMENKGLNIFNASCILAKPDTTTDDTFQRIESIIAHEYFHNWSGNRVTCRDWFQLSLKEGFTVFRDTLFSAAMNSADAKRIEDVLLLRTEQFLEDSGPMAHSVRPDSYIEISNFYTLTVYQKGAEIVRMLWNILGNKGFRRGADLYFSRNDGKAVTCDDFIKAMEDANAVNLQQFMLWYDQVGTPVVRVKDSYDAKAQRYRIELTQQMPHLPKQKVKKPLHIPFEFGLLDQEGLPISLDDQGNTHLLLELKKEKHIFNFENIERKPVPSLLRGFSAPVKVEYVYKKEQQYLLAKFDTDSFNRWDATQRLFVDEIFNLMNQHRDNKDMVINQAFLEYFTNLLPCIHKDPAIAAKMLTLPDENYLLEQLTTVHVMGLYKARTFLLSTLGKLFQEQFQHYYDATHQGGSYRPIAEDIAKRQFKNVCLDYLATDNTGLITVLKHYEAADNMTDKACALRLLAREAPLDKLRPILDAFYHQWQKDRQVIDLWFAIQAASPLCGTLDDIVKLTQHPAYDDKNPNRVRAVLGVFARKNFLHFHHKDGDSYAFLVDQVHLIDCQNPQLAARLIMPLSHWKKFDTKRQNKIQELLSRLLKENSLSKDLYEVVVKSLG